VLCQRLFGVRLERRRRLLRCHRSRSDDVVPHQFRRDFRTAHKGRALLLEQPVGRSRLKIKYVAGDEWLNDVQHETRLVRHQRTDVGLRGDLERGKVASHHVNLLGAGGHKALANVAVRRELLMQFAR
jgi:hypothetical protein